MHGKEGHPRFELYEQNRCDGRGYRDRGMECDAERTVIRIGIDRMDVRHLDAGEKRQEHQADDHYDRGLEPRVAMVAHPWVHCGQNLEIPVERGLFQEYTTLDARSQNMSPGQVTRGGGTAYQPGRNASKLLDNEGFFR